MSPSHIVDRRCGLRRPERRSIVDLAGADADVTVIDRRNYHLFQPLLYQVATAGLSPAQIAQPIRSILRKASNVRVILGRVTGVDRSAVS